RILPAKYTADVHHRFSKNADDEWPRISRRGADICRRASFGMTERPTRVEKDSMGEMSLPASALHGASTHRAVLNFPVSGYRSSRPFIRARGWIKWPADQQINDPGCLERERAPLTVPASEEVVDGK